MTVVMDRMSHNPATASTVCAQPMNSTALMPSASARLTTVMERMIVGITQMKLDVVSEIIVVIGLLVMNIGTGRWNY